jgi:hypothetical protein
VDEQAEVQPHPVQGRAHGVDDGQRQEPGVPTAQLTAQSALAQLKMLYAIVKLFRSCTGRALSITSPPRLHEDNFPLAARL